MDEEVGTWAVGVVMVVFSIVGIILAAGAKDDGMYVFGWSLAAFGVAFIADLMRQSFAETQRAGKTHHHG